MEQQGDAPISGALLQVLDRVDGAVHMLESDDAGEFELPRNLLGHASYHIVVTKEGYGKRMATGVLASLDPIVLQLTPELVIRGRVVVGSSERTVQDFRVIALHARQSGKPSPGARAWTTSQEIPEGLAVDQIVDVTHADGAFELGGLRDGKYVLIVQADGFAPTVYRADGRSSGQAAGIVAALPKRCKPVQICLLEMGAMFVRVIDAQTGQPLDAASASLFAECHRRAFHSPTRSVAHEADGRIRVPVSLDQRGRIASTHLQVSMPGYASHRTSFGGQENGWTLTVELGQAARVRGLVLDEHGAPIVGAGLFVTTRSSGDLVGRARTDGNGSFEVSGLRGAVDLGFSCLDPTLQHVLALAPLRLEHGETRTIDVGGNLNAGIFGRVTILGDAVGGVSVDLSRARSGYLGISMQTDVDGSFRFAGLVEDEYELVARVDNAEVSMVVRGSVNYKAGQAIERNFNFGRLITGKVIDDSTGEPPDENNIILDARLPDAVGGQGPIEIYVGGGGRFGFHVSTRGVYELSLVSGDGYSLQALQVLLGQEQAGEELLIRLVPLDAAGQLTLRITDAVTGEAITQGSVEYGGPGDHGYVLFEAGGLILEDLGQELLHYSVAGTRYVRSSGRIQIQPSLGPQRLEVSLYPSNCVRVTTVLSGSHSKQAGLQVGDLVTHCGATQLQNKRQLERALISLPADQLIELRVLRGASQMLIHLRGGGLDMEIENWRLE